MGEQVYHVDGFDIQFSYAGEWGCLCTFPYNDQGRLGPDRVASLALLGAATVLAHNGDLDTGLLPEDVPEWIQSEILRVCVQAERGR